MKKQGFTLIEVIVSIILVSVVLVSLLTTLVKLRETYDVVHENTDVLIYSSSISRIINNDLIRNNGIRHVTCNSMGSECNMILGNDKQRRIEILTINNAEEETNKNKNTVNHENIKTTLRYTDTTEEDKLIYMKTLELDKYTDTKTKKTTTNGYNFLSMKTNMYEYGNEENETKDILTNINIGIYNGLDTNDKSYNIELYSSARYDYDKIIGKVYKITFNNNDADIIGTIGIDEIYGVGYYKTESAHRKEDKINKIEVPRKENKAFKGYYYYTGVNEGEIVIDSEGNIVSSNRLFKENIDASEEYPVVKAEWGECNGGYYVSEKSICEPREYTITFDKQEGSGGVENLKIKYNTKMSKIEVPTKTNYNFLGYYTSTEGGEQYFDAEGNPTKTVYDYIGDRNLYARWEEKKYSITYDYNYDKLYKTGEYLELGYDVDWDKDFSISLTMNASTPGKRYFMVGGFDGGANPKELNIEITASNKLRMWANCGGLDISSNEPITFNEDIDIEYTYEASSGNWTLTGKGNKTNAKISGTYKLTGKSNKKLLAGAKDNRPGASPFGDITIKNLKITKKISAKDKIDYLDLSESGIFDGWYTSKTGGTKINSDTLSSPTSDIVLYAHWKNQYEEKILNGAYPVLKSPMIPINLSDAGVATYADIKSKWYSYADKKWANAVILVDKPSKTYNVGDTIAESDIRAYFVWIPKYSYRIWNLGEYEGKVTTLPSDSGPREIEIQFGTRNTTEVAGECITPMKSGLSKAESATKGCSVGDLMTHPVFLSIPSNGFWIGKFDTGYNQNNDVTIPITDTSSWTTEMAQINEENANKIIVKPDVYSWRLITAHNMFLNAYNFNRTLNSHMTKNTEWGAVAYLSHSKYGINKAVRINNNSNFKTGYAANTEDAAQSTTNFSIWTAQTGYLASTTGNISGVYDMSGGAYEYMAAILDNAFESTGFSSTDITGKYSSYFDIYSSSVTSYKKRILGDATSELGPFIDTTSSWYSDDARIFDLVWIGRGGNKHYGTAAGQFASLSLSGVTHAYDGTRLSLTIN